MPIKRLINQASVKFLLTAVVGGLFSAFSMPVQAADMYGNNGIKFDVDTTVEFTFLESNGAYQSVFGVINLDTGEKTPLVGEAKPSDQPQDVTKPSDYQDDTQAGDRSDFKGTPGDSVPNPLPEFTFKANNRYAFYLESTYNGRPAGILYSIDSQNPGGNQQTRFEGGAESLLNGGSLVRWDDTGSVLVRTGQEDRDFDDFVVRVGGHEACRYNNANSVSSKQNFKGSFHSSGSGVKCTGK